MQVRRSDGRLRRVGITALGWSAFVLVSIALVEGALWVAHWTLPGFDLKTLGEEPIKVKDVQFGHINNPKLADSDERGFRNPQALERADWLILGDSHTYGTHVSRASAWPTRLDAMTEARVYNMGVGGYGPVNYMLTAEAGMALEYLIE